METTVMNVAVSHGIWAVLAVFLLVYIVKSNEKRDEKQEEREKNYQSVIEKLTEKLEILHQVQSDLSEIKEKLFVPICSRIQKSITFLTAKSIISALWDAAFTHRGIRLS